ncbi:ethyl tert-butyl ether degradation protein EthD [Paraburkholderia sp. DGU8]|uniref:ethyl tert-butyl ether degradation protein EthD n=1 Tax=Paraburkholderia sp. DGU8 TaxID=3161997 RepID=UPI003467ABC7
MQIALFLTYRTPTSAGPAPLAEFARQLAATPGMRRAVMHAPAAASDPYLKVERAPQLVLQMYFDELMALEAASARAGSLQALTDCRTVRWTGDAEMTQQAMAVRRYVTPSPRTGQTTLCSYLVAYEGAPQDYDAWLGHYLTAHVPLMGRLPEIRELEIYTRLDSLSALPARREFAVQRNKVVFDDAEALTRALNSAIRHEMRRDFEVSAPFDGHNVHFPMTSHVVTIASDHGL